MESLAYLVVIIFMVTLLSGPFAIALTSRRLVKFLNSKESVPWAIVNVLRKIIHALTITIGTFLGFSLMSADVTIAKFLVLTQLSLHILPYVVSTSLNSTS